MEDNIKIWCSYHDDNLIKEYNLENTNLIQLFKTTDLNLEKENINYLNKYIAELVTYYYVWKNQIKSDYIGFCHYRRFFEYIDIEKIKEDKAVQCYICWNTKLNYLFQLNEWCKDCNAEFNFKYKIHFINFIYEKYKVNLFSLSNEKKDFIGSGRTIYLFKWNDFNKFCEILFGYIDYIKEKENKSIDEINKEICNIWDRKIGVFLEIISSLIIDIFFNPFMVYPDKNIEERMISNDVINYEVFKNNMKLIYGL